MKLAVRVLDFGFLLSGWVVLRAEKPKERDSDVNDDEARLPHYDLPPLLVNAQGRAITTPEEWMNIRRPE